ncbi:EpsI family protein [Sandaracinobacter sp. RS1-74]|uniref:exosortase-associated protein EpsI, V-type n=1 Tax=Sandaracinobacteroides sayramensis TaxID=2913411 RepID=UPI001EDADAB4|nr:exosortase-associated protein EpsI, V-type [Sandaracinobacteroides sayramensis]MCG2840232.1 EpsI family protein [Sandaracinobacteroides sayramensis]
MLGRRELLLGLPLLAAAGGALALTPRNRLNLLNGKELEKLVPLEFAGWHVTPSNAVILPEAQEGSLAAQLYSQTVSRLYLSETDLPVMMVIAYGDTQSDQLQLHRPEVCYTAVGFEISESRKVVLPVAPPPDTLPARELVATSNDRIEPILYWTRIGDYLPASGNEQRLLKLRTEMRGYLADGALIRLSTVVPEPTPESFATLQRFAKAMLDATDPLGLPALVGRPVAAAILEQRG